MAATEVKVPTTAAYTDALITVALGESITVGIHTDSANGLPGNEGVKFFIDTPDNDQQAFRLTGRNPTTVVAGPCDLIGKKGVTSVAIGVYKFIA